MPNNVAKCKVVVDPDYLEGLERRVDQLLDPNKLLRLNLNEQLKGVLDDEKLSTEQKSQISRELLSKVYKVNSDISDKEAHDSSGAISSSPPKPTPFLSGPYIPPSLPPTPFPFNPNLSPLTPQIIQTPQNHPLTPKVRPPKRAVALSLGAWVPYHSDGSKRKRNPPKN